MRRQRKFLKAFSITMVIAFLNQLLLPLGAFALTSGPTQPEVQSFQPMGTSDLVDLFSGDFKYNIPLLDVGGYPVNLSYQSGIQMDQEASWVGLGWNLNVGAIVRNMRGVPDEFTGGNTGDEVVHTRQMRPNKTWGVSLGKDLEVIGIQKASAGLGQSVGLGLTYNNYSGFDMNVSQSAGLSAMRGAKHPWNVNLGINASARNGLTVSAGASYSGKIKKVLDNNSDFNTGISTSINSRSGMRALNVNAGTAFQSVALRSRLGLASWNQNIQLAHQTYTPTIDFPMRTTNRNFTFKMGPGVTGFIALNNVKIAGFSSVQELKTNTITSPVYGYLNLQKGKDDDNAVLDFNREKDGGFSVETPHLPLTNLTYDTYVVTGQGISGAFRAFRGDVGAVFDRRNETSSNGQGNGGLQLNQGGDNVVGFSWLPAWMTAINGKWVAENELLPKVEAAEENTNTALYQPATFRMMGEQTRSDDAFDLARGNTDPVRPRLAGTLGVVAEAAWATTTSDNSSHTTPISSKVLRDNRIPGNTAINALSALEASQLGLVATIPNYTLNGTLSNPTELGRNDPTAGRKQHHPSEFTVLSGDGSRYIYGIPAYNLSQKEVTFSVGGAGLDTTLLTYNDGLIDYNATGNLRTNQEIKPTGRDQFLDVTETDPYAHSYLLSAFLSADYEDLTGDGPSVDDLGSYVKFNYSRAHSAYRWRVPFQENNARHNLGFRADPTDDKASYSYGEKEVWYLHSIESRDYIALFTLSSRDDGYGVTDEHGGLDQTMNLQKLDQIDLFARREYLDPPSGQSPIPIKSVHFVYDYALCPGIPNSNTNGGKLTLKAVYSTFYQSQKGKMNSYRFHYDGSNPSYNIQENDRWGCYSPSLSNNLGSLKNSDYPYVTQNAAQAGTYAAAWSMTSVDLPSGGKIEVEYEADDYGFVQNRPAARMFSIVGLSDAIDDAAATSQTKLYDADADEEYNYLYFDLEEPIHKTASDDLDQERFYGDYVNGLGEFLYFKCLVELNAKSWAPQPGLHKEFVAGYAQLAREDNRIVAGLDESSLVSGAYTRGYIKVALESVQDQDQGSGLQVHPIAKSAWDIMVINQNPLVYRGSTSYDPEGKPLDNIVEGMLGFYRDLYLVFSSRNRWMHNQQAYGQNIDKSQSFIRLNDPNRAKYGGGLRVKKVTMYDNWDDMTGVSGAGFSYGQEYDYSMDEAIPDLVNGGMMNRKISSGVAAYEPLIGGDENPFRQPVKYEKSNFLAADERYFQEEPIGESMFPGPSVGYSKVTVRNLSHANVQKSATGYVVNEFYTARDFPTLVRNTEPKKRRSGSNYLPNLINANSRDYMTASEGFVVERNDMHGKPKSVFAYPEPDPNLPPNKLVGREISGTQYIYRTDADNPAHLNNTVDVIFPTGSVNEATMGMTIDMITDMREYRSQATSANLEVQIDVNSTPPVVTPSSIPYMQMENTRFRSAVVTKIIDRYGILEKVVKFDRQAQIPTENIAYDSETGQTLLSRTWNEFRQPIYDLVYPAHWAYDAGMGQAYKTMAYTKKDRNMAVNGAIDVGADIAHFAVGDQVAVDNHSGILIKGPYWVTRIIGSNLYLVGRDGILRDQGNTVPGSAVFDLKILRSARKNMASAGIGAVQFLEESPIVAGTLNVDAVKNHVLAASAAEFDDQWKMLLRPAPLPDSCNWLQYLEPLATAVNTSGLPFSLPNGVTYVGYFGTSTAPPDQIIHGEFFDCNGTSFFSFSQIIESTNGNQCTSGNVFMSNISIAPAPSQPGYSVTFDLSCTVVGGQAVGSINDQPVWPCPPSAQSCTTTTTRPPNTAACLGVGEVLNPFVQGLKQHWRPKVSYAFLEDRSYVNATPGSVPRLREDGVLADFVPFWSYNSGLSKWVAESAQSTPDIRWQYASLAEEYHPRGIEVESSDPVVTYSGAVPGYDQSLVTAMGQNTEYRQLAFEGFEDYVLRDATANLCELYHWDFISYTDMMSTEAAHSGLRSLKVDGAFPMVMSETITCTGSGSLNGDNEYATGCDDRLSLFEPTPGDYVLLAWTKQVNSASYIPALKADRAAINISFTDVLGQPVGSPVNVPAKGVMIEGWQRMEYDFTVPANAVNMYVRFENSDPTKGAVYYDDVRISPKDAIVGTYVYHPYNRRLMAEMDANHYATFYEYDEDGALVRVKKETERGIHTVQEARTSLRKVGLN